MIDLDKIVKEQFHFEKFKAGQRETIESVLVAKDTLSILPTGTGKSLCYQLPSYLFSGSTLIVSPLLSLMEDQVQQLKQQGEKRVIALNSLLTYPEKKQVLSQLSFFKFIFISPEMLLQKPILNSLKGINIGLFVVDEAHCISQWGIDFRPEYTQLLGVKASLNNPVTLALTATATNHVLADIQKKLFGNVENLTVVRLSVNRPNIVYKVAQTNQKWDILFEFITTQQAPGIIYFSSKKKAEEITRKIARESSLRVAYYHGDMSPQDRSVLQQQFLQDELDILCATSAFGMGVNKKNIRFILHYHLPSSLEAYMQETGRAGRDGKLSQALLLYQPGDEAIHHFLRQDVLALQKELQQLDTQSVDAVTNLLPTMSELQQKWVQGYLSGEYQFDELNKELADKNSEKQVQLEQMLAYIQLTKCRRNYMTDYFNESRLVSQKICCDNCGLPVNILKNNGLKSLEKDPLKESWQKQLKNLFFVKI